MGKPPNWKKTVTHCSAKTVPQVNLHGVLSLSTYCPPSCFLFDRDNSFSIETLMQYLLDGRGIFWHIASQILSSMGQNLQLFHPRRSTPSGNHLYWICFLSKKFSSQATLFRKLNKQICSFQSFACSLYFSLRKCFKSNSMQISTKVRQGSKNKNRSSFTYW